MLKEPSLLAGDGLDLTLVALIRPKGEPLLQSASRDLMRGLAIESSILGCQPRSQDRFQIRDLFGKRIFRSEYFDLENRLFEFTEVL